MRGDLEGGLGISGNLYVLPSPMYKYIHIMIDLLN